ncbi:hybrid sensor histidine kinase/response regulator [Roseateles terrae]|uniref:histidine kinase n=1 Tax=Roseateles terrae TaxID=431060 RepID=A0ABR6GTA5_9BURK|nr:ATP-binding protein [Roseateles terrae]MBB3195337.1 signal transduction histidine kinase [Roseateles terrae]OWQ87330.1 hypothetical protein CDN98_10930 [Roseateles terrae]
MIDNVPQTPVLPAVPALLPGHPALHPLLRGTDWAATALGDPARWSAPLRTTVQTVMDSVMPMWVAWGPQLSMLYNEPYIAMLGAKHPAALGAPLQSVWSEVWSDVSGLINEALAGQGVHRENMPLQVNRNGREEPAWFSFIYTPVRDEAGAVQGMVCSVWETTDKVLRLQQLDDSERQFQTLFERIDEGFCVIEFIDGPHGPLSDYVHVLANPAYAANAGIPNVVGQKVREMVPAEAEGWVEIYRNVLLSGVPIRFERELERTGRYLELAAFRVEPVERRQVAVLFQDVTQRHRTDQALRELNDTLERRVQEELDHRLRTEEALRQSQKMEAVGQLTGGIAHDFNNMLAVVVSSLDLLARKYLRDDALAMRYVDSARNATRRAAQLTQRLLAFSRQQPLKPEAVNANRLVAGMSDLLRHSMGGAIEIETVLGGGLWRTHADPNQLENAILNLSVNARDAMPDGGRLTIETANAHLDERYTSEQVGVFPGQYVMVAVSDTGSGMTPEVITRAFDPFFTTKEVGRGTGLGLSQVYGFVKQSGGHVRIYSELAQGTTVKIYLPRLLNAPDEDVTPVASLPMPLSDGQETVLVVEDEESVRRSSVDALTELGYRVLEASGGEAALKLIDSHPEIALVFADVVMPGMNGRKLAEEVRRRRPALKVLFTTGYTRNAVVHNGVLDAGVELLGKPFTLDELAARVRAVLDKGD